MLAMTAYYPLLGEFLVSRAYWVVGKAHLGTYSLVTVGLLAKKRKIMAGLGVSRVRAVALSDALSMYSLKKVYCILSGFSWNHV